MDHKSSKILFLSLTLLCIMFANLQAATLTFNDIMAKVKQNEDKIKDLTADVTVISDDPNSHPKEQYKLWMKGNKSKVQDLFPIQKTSIIETTSDSVKLNGQSFLSIEEETDPNVTRTDIIESSSGDIYVLKTVVTSTDGSEETTRYYVDYTKGTLVKTEDESKYQGNAMAFFEISYSSVLMGDIWVMTGTVTKTKDFLENKEYTTTETRSNIIINSGIPGSVFEQTSTTP